MRTPDYQNGIDDTIDNLTVKEFAQKRAERGLDQIDPDKDLFVITHEGGWFSEPAVRTWSEVQSWIEAQAADPEGVDPLEVDIFRIGRRISEEELAK